MQTFDGGDQAVADEALIGLLSWLQGAGYGFVNPTPATHAMVRGRQAAGNDDILRDVFGWVRPFRIGQLDRAVFELARAAGVIDETEAGLVSLVRISTVEDRLYLHSAPTRADDAVFLGPDTYRYVRLLRTVLDSGPQFGRALDIGTGAGVGALTLLSARTAGPDAEVWGSDINPLALRLARLNARHADLNLRTVLASGMPPQPADFDLIAANPPYVAGNRGKTYRDGGDDYGAALGLDWVRLGIDRLRPGGRFILYTGAPIVRGRDLVRCALSDLARARAMSLDYQEIDPDVFGATLRQRDYHDVERIAAVGAVLTVR